MIPYGKQNINQLDIKAVIDVLNSEWLTQGPVIQRFEQAVATKVGANYGVAVNSATSALHIACLALDLGENDWLWTSPNTFVASANCALYCGANIDFVDIDPKTYNMSIDALREKLELSERLGKLPKIVIPVHFAGQSCDMYEIHKLSKQFGFKIIEDASHAIGGSYRNLPVGNCVYSDITVFSFHPVKIITTGEGGMAVCNNADLAERMSRFRSHGITRKPNQMKGISPGAWYYEQLELGYNFRMTDIQAALGLSQLDRLEEFVLRRRDIASVYDTAFADLPLIPPFQQDPGSSFHLYVVQVDSQKRTSIFNSLREANFGVNVHYRPVHMQPYYQNKGFCEGDYPQAELYYTRAVSLPIFAMLEEADQSNVIKSLGKFLNE